MTDIQPMLRRKLLREDDCRDHWTPQQLAALALQLVEVAAIVVIAWVALFTSREMEKSQSLIVNALRGLHTEVQRSDAMVK